MPLARLQIFVSYATADENVGVAIAEELRRAFGAALLKVSIATEFRVGDFWRQEIEDALNNTSILLIVATGRQKLSHSFTGFEVGYFKASTKHRPRMARFASDQFIIPLAIATDIPDPVADIQSLQIEAPLELLTIDSSALNDPPIVDADVTSQSKSDQLYKLFDRIYTIISSASNFNAEERAAYEKAFRECSVRLLATIGKELRQRIWTEDFPERKIIVRVKNDTDSASGDDPLSGATIEFIGKSFEVFGLSVSQTGGALKCEHFLASIRNKQVKVGWAEILRSQIVAAQNGEFHENKRLVASPDQKRFFRLFVARSILYYSGMREIHIYIVEIKSRDYGDQETTMLLKAMALGLEYRFLFLERNSVFSPAVLEFTMLDVFRDRISTLVQELDYIIWMSKDAGLGEPENLLKIYGHALQPGELDQKALSWEKSRKRLYAGASNVLAARERGELRRRKGEFIEALKAFCEDTREMNREYTARTLRSLEAMIFDEEGRAAERHDVLGISRSTDESPAVREPPLSALEAVSKPEEFDEDGRAVT